MGSHARYPEFQTEAHHQNLSLAAQYLISLQDAQTGGFSFASGNPASLVATAYAVLGLESTGALKTLKTEAFQSAIAFIKRAQGVDRHFHEPQLNSETIRSHEHDRKYFEEETDAFCLQALDALGADFEPPPLPPSWVAPGGVSAFLDHFSWVNPWLTSNRVMFALARLAYAIEKEGQGDLLSVVDEALGWLESRQDPQTGFWRGSEKADLKNAMAATVHFAFFYLYRRRALRYAEKIIDSCLALQDSQGLFGGEVFGHTCFDYDAIQLLWSTRTMTLHRKSEVNGAFGRVHGAVLNLQNADGGFPDSKWRYRSLSGWKLPQALARSTSHETYSNCLSFLSCRASASNAYSTWLRQLILDLTASEPVERNYFRRLPFLGYGLQ